MNPSGAETPAGHGGLVRKEEPPRRGVGASGPSVSEESLLGRRERAPRGREVKGASCLLRRKGSGGPGFQILSFIFPDFTKQESGCS